MTIVGEAPVLGTELNISSDAGYSSHPYVSYASNGDQFLVSWEQEDVENISRIVQAAG